MKGRGHKNWKSPERLLDAVCSMAGAIIVIAILVKWPANIKSQNPSVVRASAAMTMRKIATAEADLKDAEAMKERMPKPGNSEIAASIIEKRRLEDALRKARSDQARASGDLQNSATEQGGNLDKEWKKLDEDWKDMQRRVTEASNAIKTQEENTRHLQSKIKAIGGLIGHEKEHRVVKLRFPHEREKTKQSYPIICKFGKIYPVHDASMRDNTKTIKWVTEGDGTISLPIESEGWSPEKDKLAIDGMLRELGGSEFYVIFIVFPDSFDAYQQLRDRVTASHMDFGLSIEPADASISWGKDGHTPPPL